MIALGAIRSNLAAASQAAGRTSVIIALAMLIACPACSMRSYALRATADALSGSGGGLASEEDPQLAEQAAPFALLTMEQLSAELPGHRGLRLALASGFTQFAYAFVHQEADFAEERSLEKAKQGWLRARRLYLRGRNHALKGLSLAHPGLDKVLLGGRADAVRAALQRVGSEDIGLLYWAGVSWALAISVAKDSADLVGDMAVVEAIMARALLIDESYERGAIHEFYVSYDATRSKTEGGGPEEAKRHLDRALELSKGHRLGALVSYAEGVLVARQDKAEFSRVLDQVLSFDIHADEELWRRERLANIISQKRARWLLSRKGELFAE